MLGPLPTPQTIIDTVQTLISAFLERSVVIIFENNTDLTLTKKFDSESSGGLAPSALPSPTIQPQNYDVYGAQSSLGKGAVGLLEYTSSFDPDNNCSLVIVLNYSNPLAGDNTYSATVHDTLNPNQPSSLYQVIVSGSAGQNSQVRYTLMPAD